MTQKIKSNDKLSIDLRVDVERIKANILELAAIGRNEDDSGIYRMAFSDKDMEAKRWLTERIKDAGLIPSTDGAANVSGLLDRGVGGARVFVGSHIDTVPCAGMLDGTLGVIVGLECLRVLEQSGCELKHDIELIAFSDEEGRFGGTMGSEAFTGTLTLEKLRAATDLSGVSLHDAMTAQGLNPLDALDARRNMDDVKAYLELHIEQGPVLDEEHLQVGIVNQITGLRSWALRFTGVANHAGTTPMHYRRDAFMALADFAHEIPRILDENGGENSRATIGKAEILPGAPNSVPGIVDFSLDFRDPSVDVLEELSLAFQKALAAISRRRRLKFEYNVQGRIQPVESNDRLVDTLVHEADRLKLRSKVMLSGAAHDAQLVGRIAPMAMIFVPSQGGLSHSPDEWTAWEDIEAGANLMLAGLAQLVCDEIT